MKRLTIDEMKQLASERGGKCLSTHYANKDTKLLWECRHGHQWKATPGHVKYGTWCPKCAGNEKLSLSHMRELAEERGGKCLSKNYVNNETKLLWECRHGHQWEARPSQVKQGSWCPHCARNIRLQIQEMRQIAEQRGGKCLSTHYVNAHTKLLWECAEGHHWKATPNHIKTGTWCPECSSGLGERICRELFEQIFGKRFPKSFPRWLVNEKGNQMELDGYCPSLKLAFEHHGGQHYFVDGLFTKGEDALKSRHEADELKQKLCRQRGISLLEVPEIPARLRVNKTKSFIRKELKRHNISFPAGFENKSIDFKKTYSTSGSKQALKEIQGIAEKLGGKCLSRSYINARTKLLWQCDKGHKWKATPDNIKRGSWCPYCVGNARSTIGQMQDIARAQGGKCLSKTYVNAWTKLTWECIDGHRWKATPHQVKQGKWCPYCAQNVTGNIDEVRRIADQRGGKCLSKDYTNSHTRLLLECAEGHKWEATPANIRRGRWCPLCGVKESARKRSLGTEYMMLLAKERGGECLSKTYKNNRTKLLWKCSAGHCWEATPDNIKKGKWCPQCYREKRTSSQKNRH